MNTTNFGYVAEMLDVLKFSSWVVVALVSMELLPQVRATLGFFRVNRATSCSLNVAAVRT